MMLYQFFISVTEYIREPTFKHYCFQSCKDKFDMGNTTVDIIKNTKKDIYIVKWLISIPNNLKICTNKKIPDKAINAFLTFIISIIILYLYLFLKDVNISYFIRYTFGEIRSSL